MGKEQKEGPAINKPNNGQRPSAERATTPPQAETEAFQQSPRYHLIRQNMIRSGILRPRAEIEKEVAERQRRWKESSTGQASPSPKPPKK